MTTSNTFTDDQITATERFLDQMDAWASLPQGQIDYEVENTVDRYLSERGFDMEELE